MHRRTVGSVAPECVNAWDATRAARARELSDFKLTHDRPLGPRPDHPAADATDHCSALLAFDHDTAPCHQPISTRAFTRPDFWRAHRGRSATDPARLVRWVASRSSGTWPAPIAAITRSKS